MQVRGYKIEVTACIKVVTHVAHSVNFPRFWFSKMASMSCWFSSRYWVQPNPATEIVTQDKIWGIDNRNLLQASDNWGIWVSAARRNPLVLLAAIQVDDSSATGPQSLDTKVYALKICVRRLIACLSLYFLIRYCFSSETGAAYTRSVVCFQNLQGKFVRRVADLLHVSRTCKVKLNRCCDSLHLETERPRASSLL